ncbi:protein of unknown function [Nitrospira japonica]|uniref:Uncharacterized protein n=1 Tax=Nitrospira japonica TaxID=1325564 RepID=A0A1W1I259_9BACT|nr:protein of unknown function [Nitrospira japonica]
MIRLVNNYRSDQVALTAPTTTQLRTLIESYCHIALKEGSLYHSGENGSKNVNQAV